MSVDGPLSREDVLVGRAVLLGQVARYIALHDLALDSLLVEDFSSGDTVHIRAAYKTQNRDHAVAVAAAFGCVAQDDRRTYEVPSGGSYELESWESDVLEVSWCRRVTGEVTA